MSLVWIRALAAVEFLPLIPAFNSMSIISCLDAPAFRLFSIILPAFLPRSLASFGSLPPFKNFEYSSNSALAFAKICLFASSICSSLLSIGYFFAISASKAVLLAYSSTLSSSIFAIFALIFCSASFAAAAAILSAIKTSLFAPRLCISPFAISVAILASSLLLPLYAT